MMLPAGAPAPLLRPFDYDGVRLLPSRFADQVERARDTYSNAPDDDFLRGFREAAGRPAPGNHLGGWCKRDSSVIFGQIVSGLARLGRATGDDRLTAKAVRLFEGWRETAGLNGDARMGTYAWDKLVCGLVDLHLYADYAPALPYLAETTDWAARTFDRTRAPAGALDWDGRHPGGTVEWYTLGENLYRAYLASGDSRFRDFADVWRYERFWGMFAETSRPTDAHTVHAYSHVNSLSSAAAVYAATGDARYLTIARNAYDYLRETQLFATGGYGPVERLLPVDGRLGESLEYHFDSAEIPCGAWSGFKLARYLTAHTGEARYGDWTETLLYNGIGAALPTLPGGKTFYYADYRIGVGEKLYFFEAWPCCSGTYIQNMADYHNIIYYRDDDGGLYVNLFVPSEVNWTVGGEPVTVRQTTAFPESETTTLTVSLARPTLFRLAFRVPGWAAGEITAMVNGERADLTPPPTPPLPHGGRGGESADGSLPRGGSGDQATGSPFPRAEGGWGVRSGWLAIEREWRPGDRIELRLPMSLALRPVDAWHPRRAAVTYGPVVLVEDARFKRPFTLESGAALAERLVPDGPGLRFRPVTTRPQDIPTGAFQPFYSWPERLPYRMYLDLDREWIYG